MNQPDLQKQLEKQLEKIRSAIAQLADIDPMKSWFEMECHVLKSTANESLEQVNGQLSALRQVQKLLFDHCVKIQNPTHVVDTSSSLPASYLSQQAKIPANVMEMAKQQRFSIDPELLFAKDFENDLFDPVSPTAKIVGYLRSRDPALRIDSQMELEQQGKSILNQLTVLDEHSEFLMASLFQYRHHTFNTAIAKFQARQIVELASGVSPRGLQWARSMPESIYVETDLPALMIHKAKRLRNHILASEEVNRGILHCAAVDVLNFDSLEVALEAIDVDVPFVFVSEGLLLYFSETELGTFLDHMSSILNRHPKAVWISDFVTRVNLRELIDSQPSVGQAVREVFAMTGRKVIAKNHFESDDMIVEMLQRKGLRVKDTMSLAEVAAARNCGSGDQAVAKLLGTRKIWTVSVNR